MVNHHSRLGPVEVFPVTELGALTRGERVSRERVCGPLSSQETIQMPEKVLFSNH